MARAGRGAKAQDGPPALIIEQWPISRLEPYERNPRVLTDQNIDLMCANIREYGFRIPIVARSDGLVVDGHLRLSAALKLGMATVPVALADDLTETQIRAFRIAVNQSATWAEWNTELLAAELSELKIADYDLDLLGFSDLQLVQFMADRSGGLTDPEDTPEPPAVPVSQRGDVWLLGATARCPKCGKQTSVGTKPK
jgi:ParB-like chromosome segregation protein Spo0J